MIFSLPNNILLCLQILESNGFESFCVGGCVRDMLMHKVPHDYDITTNASPEQIMRIFPKTIPTGIRHGTVTVLLENDIIEVTTYRIDGDYTNHRAPDSVKFVGNIYDDLARRDFKMNAIAYNPKTGIVDPFCGSADINNRIISCVGDANVRFDEDALRILRCFRFAAQLNFKIQAETLSASLSKCKLLENISCERIFSEIKKLIMAPDAAIINRLLECGAFEFLDIGKSCLPDYFNNLPQNFYIRLAVLCKIKSPTLLKPDKKSLRYVNIFRKLFEEAIPSDIISFKKIYGLLEKPLWYDYISARRQMGTPCDYISRYIDIIESQNQPYKISMLDISGNDLMNLGLKGGEIKSALERLLDICIENPLLNHRDILINALTATLK